MSGFLYLFLGLHQLVIELKSMVRYLDVTLAFHTFVVIFAHPFFDLRIESLRTLLWIDRLFNEITLLFFKLTLIELIFGIDFVFEFINGRDVLLAELFPYSLDDLFHGHVCFCLCLESRFKLSDLLLLYLYLLCLRPYGYDLILNEVLACPCLWSESRYFLFLLFYGLFILGI